METDRIYKKIKLCSWLIIFVILFLLSNIVTGYASEEAKQLKKKTEQHLLDVFADKCVFIAMVNDDGWYEMYNYMYRDFSSVCLAKRVKNEFGRPATSYYELLDINAKDDTYRISKYNYIRIGSVGKPKSNSEPLIDTVRYYYSDKFYKILKDDLGIVVKRSTTQE